MLDSVSVHSGVEHENYPVALIGDHQEEMKPKEPDVSASKIVICFHQSQKYFFRNSFDKKKQKYDMMPPKSTLITMKQMSVTKIQNNWVHIFMIYLSNSSAIILNLIPQSHGKRHSSQMKDA